LSLVNETLRPETETFDFQSETRPRRSYTFLRDRDVGKMRLETEASRPRPHPCPLEVGPLNTSREPVNFLKEKLPQWVWGRAPANEFIAF